MEKVIAINIVWVALVAGMLASTFALYTQGSLGDLPSGKFHFAANM